MFFRNGSYYGEQIKVLEFTHPEVFRRFSMGGWVIQENPGWFIAVSGDMKVEQTIQRVGKGPGGHYVVGQTRKAAAVAEFELLFHEVGNIVAALNLLTSNQSLQHTESHIPRSLNPSRRIDINQHVAKLLDFVKARKNPYSITPGAYIPLNHWLTGIKVNEAVAQHLLKVTENGERVYKDYRQERIVEKLKKISARIPRRNLPQFGSLPQKDCTTIEEKQELSAKAIAKAQKNMEILCERGMELKSIISHDLFSISPLFEGDLPAKTDKYKLVAEIEKLLDLTIWSRDTILPTHVVVDFMSKVRMMPMAEYDSIGNLLGVLIKAAVTISKRIQYVHFSHDSYIELSLKEGERLRRYNPGDGIEMIGMNLDSPLPQQVEKFWACDKNKQNLQLLLRQILPNHTRQGQTELISSSMVIEGELYPAVTSSGEEIPELLSWIEEGEPHCIPHIDWAVHVKKAQRVIVLSNDADMFALLIYYMPYFKSVGVKEVWQQYGVGDNRRMLPIHQVLTVLGEVKCKAILKAHILTGEDCLSKIGTKHAAIHFSPEKYLINFGESSELSDRDFALAEEFLVKGYAGVRSATQCKTFDELRLEKYIGGKSGIDTLPPTSSVVKGHIHRGALLLYRLIHLLDQGTKELDPHEHGWEENFDIMLPQKNLKLIPINMLNTCSCGGKCNNTQCSCREKNVKCTVFCHGKQDNLSCSNKLIR